MDAGPIKVGVIADQTGPLSVVGLANANVARMVVGDLNAKGGLLGRRLELRLEDSATDDDVAAAVATKLVEQEVDVVFGGIYSSTRQAIKEPVVVKGRTLYIYPEQYEGEEADPLIFCTGPVPAQQVDPFIPWLMQQTGAKKFYLPSADYVWPHVMNRKVREVVTAHGGTIVGEEYFPLDHADYRATVEKIAINAVMAGCRPEYLPVLIAIIEAEDLAVLLVDPVLLVVDAVLALDLQVGLGSASRLRWRWGSGKLAPRQRRCHHQDRRPKPLAKPGIMAGRSGADCRPEP